MEEFVFDYIEKKLKKSKSVDFHTWGDDKLTKFYEEIEEMYNPNSPIMEYNGNYYLITHNAGRNGKGGMDQGSPDSYDVSKVNIKEAKKVVNRPKPIDNPDFSSLIKILEEDMNEIIDGEYNENNDITQYAWEEAMKAVYGKNIFDWYNKNTD